MNFKKKNFNETIKLQKFLNRIWKPIQDPHNIQDGYLPDISQRSKAVNLCHKEHNPRCCDDPGRT